MNEKEVLSRITTSRGELQLQRWVAPDSPEKYIYEIIFNGIFLMASYNEHSSRAAATLAIEPLQVSKSRIRALIGGLGIGFTLSAALDFHHLAHVDIVEINEHIVQWAGTYFTRLNAHALSDPRVRLIQADLQDYIAHSKMTYDAIILDVDNGPTMLAMESNEGLYQNPMLEKLKQLLVTGGVMTIWAEKECPDFMVRLEAMFDDAEILTVHDTDWRGHSIDYCIYRARSFS